MLTTSLGLRIGSLGTSTYSNKLCSDELGFDLRLSVFQQHRQNFAKVHVQLIKRLGLRVCTWKTRDEAHEEAGFRRPFNDRGVRLHTRETNTGGRSWNLRYARRPNGSFAQPRAPFT